MTTIVQRPPRENLLQIFGRIKNVGPLAMIGDNEYAAENPPAVEFTQFQYEYAKFVEGQRSSIVADIVARMAPAVWDAVRMVNVYTHQGYGGTFAKGDQLLFAPFGLRDTGSAGGFPGTSPLSTWAVTRTASGAARLYPAANTVDLTTNSLNRLSHVIAGFINPVDVPKSESVQLTWINSFTEEPFDWAYDTGDGLHAYELKEQWRLPPGASYRVNIRYALTGFDKTQPIGVAIKRGADLNYGTAIV